MNGAAAHWLILARSSGSESELSAVRFSTCCLREDINERTPAFSARFPATNRSPSKPISPNLELSSSAGAISDQLRQYTTDGRCGYSRFSLGIVLDPNQVAESCRRVAAHRHPVNSQFRRYKFGPVLSALTARPGGTTVMLKDRDSLALLA